MDWIGCVSLNTPLLRAPLCGANNNNNKWRWIGEKFKSGMCVMHVKYSLAGWDKIDWVITHSALLGASNRGREVE